MKRIYHYHLKKCGGTSLTSWLGNLSPARRVYDPSWQKDWDNSWFFPRPDGLPQRSALSVGRSIFHWSDIVIDHATLRQFVPPGTFCFTFLRDPIKRIISQVTDWRRLSDVDLDSVAEDHIRECMVDSRRLSMTEFLANHGQTFGKMMFDNYLTRALAASRVGHAVLEIKDAENLLPEALYSLHTDYDFVGIFEEFNLSHNALCGLLGVPPSEAIPVLNKSVEASAQSGPSLEMTPADIHTYTSCDRIIYNAAVARFNERHRSFGQSYNTAVFERDHAEHLLASQRGHYADGGATKYEVSEPFYGSGLHGRDGGRVGVSAVWTGPQRRSTLYIPVPPYMRLSLLIWIRGYVSDVQRESLRVYVNGEAQPHGFEPFDGYADILVIDYLSNAGFVRLEIEVLATFSSQEIGAEAKDLRERAISFDGYGWRPFA